MRIIVCIKEVTHVYAPVGIDRQTNLIDPEGVVHVINPYDECAVEEAIRLKESVGGENKITLVTICPPRAESILRDCLAMGADEAIRIWDDAFQDLDSWTTSFVLAKTIRGVDYDLILCGKQAIDTNAGQVGIYLAKLLNLPLVSAVIEVEHYFPQKKVITVQKLIERGNREVVECPLPALFTVEKGLDEPRYPTLPAFLKALKKEILELDANKLNIDPKKIQLNSLVRMIKLSPPKPKPTFTIDSSLPASERLKLLMSGGIAKKNSTKILEGKVRDVVTQAVQLLIRQLGKESKQHSF